MCSRSLPGPEVYETHQNKRNNDTRNDSFPFTLTSPTSNLVEVYTEGKPLCVSSTWSPFRERDFVHPWTQNLPSPQGHLRGVEVPGTDRCQYVDGHTQSERDGIGFQKRKTPHCRTLLGWTRPIFRDLEVLLSGPKVTTRVSSSCVIWRNLVDLERSRDGGTTVKVLSVPVQSLQYGTYVTVSLLCDVLQSPLVFLLSREVDRSVDVRVNTLTLILPNRRSPTLYLKGFNFWDMGMKGRVFKKTSRSIYYYYYFYV